MAKAQLKPTTLRAMERVREYFTTWQHVSISLTGHDLEDLGLPKGPAYHRVLDATFKAKLDGMVVTEEDEYRLVKTLIEKEISSASRRTSPSFVRRAKGR